MRILFVTSEIYPLIKTGGLADVSGALPASLLKLGEDVRVLVPGYTGVLEQLEQTQRLATLEHIPGGGHAHLILGKIPHSGVSVIVIQHAALFERPGGPYSDQHHADWPDNPIRFAVLSYIGALLSCELSPLKDWQPDIVHCNDWQSGLTPAYLHTFSARRTSLKRAKSLLSIHNMAFQGCYPESWLTKLWLPKEYYQINGLEYYGQLSFLKAGCFFADHLSTVSPTYAREIQTPQYGFGLEGLMAQRKAELYGILNGLDTVEWNPENDPHLPAHYTSQALSGKKDVKTALQKRLGLPISDAPMLGAVSRLTYQKGLDMLLSIAPNLLAQGCQLVALGGGEQGMEDGFKALAAKYPQQVSTTIGYNEALSHHIMAGVDMFVMPSRFEPCGLNQMYGLRYGTPPIVSATGGLADSVVDTNEKTLTLHTATGFVMHSPSADELLACINRALHYFSMHDIWQSIQRNGMNKPLDWEISAKKYLNLYTTMLK